MSGDTPDKPIRDASTVIILREADEGLETFLLCRHHQSGFMGGAHVFPGGKVDPSDAEPSWGARVDRPTEEITAALGETDPEIGLGLLVAAVRETFEEAGVLLADAAAGVDLSATRERLHGGASFSELASEIDMKIDSRALTPYARWITPKMESRRFDTRFYVAVVPEDQTASHDGTETTSATWLRPAGAIEDMVAGRIKLAPPTVRTLDWLAQFDDAKSVIADALSRKPPLVRPRLVTGTDGWFLALPGDPEHPESDPVLPGATRMVFDNGVWRDAP
ncbi:MAG: NUDIX domain-containing protein [Deltaproteobacteria bacterium]|nr:NUDIX domain-containing protein [Deltaproteobacteria bacterium]MBW1875955.1 NUDIX domain-containing protein [Deltaproteobacteria bacterium]MBW2210921.1 NUDIX domain-containing protein [Deltaproteobacteria bacterium]MBW2214935.1 NUDIX domain-containing protein [Deltaproteobacteria bacterium]MBW2626611.1 NUDIX domain-containing protein [Deltaproteobacteria bacterium]